ncbi:hypothetical protein ACRAWD_15015 [Caulobacter segnis]
MPWGATELAGGPAAAGARTAGDDLSRLRAGLAAGRPEDRNRHPPVAGARRPRPPWWPRALSELGADALALDPAAPFLLFSALGVAPPCP